MKPLRVLAVLLPVTLVACGGGDGGGSNAMDEAEFCEYVATVEESDFEEEPDQMFAALDAMIDRAPNEDLNDALKKLREVMEKMSATDSTDEEAFAEIMSLMFDPEVIAAGETIEKFSTEVCGFPADSETGDTTTDESSTDATSGADSGYIFDDMEAGDISDAVGAYLSDEGSEAYVASSGLSSSGGYTDVTTDISGVDEIDGVAICEAIERAVTDATTDTEYAISVTLDGTEIAVRGVGESCSSA